MNVNDLASATSTATRYTPPLPFDRGDRNEGNRHFSRHRITIYDDPRDYVGGGRDERLGTRENSFIRHPMPSPRMDTYVRSAMPDGSAVFAEEFYDNRRRWEK